MIQWGGFRGVGPIRLFWPFLPIILCVAENRTVGSVCSAVTWSVPVACDSIHVEKTEAVCLNWSCFLTHQDVVRFTAVASAFYAKLAVSTRVWIRPQASHSSLRVTGTFFFKASRCCFHHSQKALKNISFLHLVTSPLCLPVSHKNLPAFQLQHGFQSPHHHPPSRCSRVSRIHTCAVFRWFLHFIVRIQIYDL